MALKPYEIAQFQYRFRPPAVDPTKGFGMLLNRMQLDENRRKAILAQHEIERAAKANEALEARRLTEFERHNPVQEAILQEQNRINEMRRQREGEDWILKTLGTGPEGRTAREAMRQRLGLSSKEPAVPGRAMAAQAITGMMPTPEQPPAAPQVPPQAPAGAAPTPPPTPRPSTPLYALPGAAEAFPYVAKSQMVPPGESREKLELIEEATREEQAQEDKFGRRYGGTTEFTVLDSEGKLTRDAAGAGVTVAGLEQMLSGLSPEERAKEFERLKGAPFNKAALGQFQEASKQALAKHKATPRRSATYVNLPGPTIPVQKPAQPAPPPKPTVEEGLGEFYKGGMSAVAEDFRKMGEAGDPDAAMVANAAPEILQMARGDTALAEQWLLDLYRVRTNRPRRWMGTGKGRRSLKGLQATQVRADSIVTQARIQFNVDDLNKMDAAAGDIAKLSAAKNPIADRAAQGRLAKMIFDGRFSDKDFQVIKGGAGRWNQLEAYFNEWTETGHLAIDYMRFLKDLGRLLRGEASARRQAAARRGASSVEASPYFQALPEEEYDQWQDYVWTSLSASEEIEREKQAKQSSDPKVQSFKARWGKKGKK
jgi:hypothetical protein